MCTKIKTLRMNICGFRNGTNHPVFKVEVSYNDGFAWSDYIHRLYDDDSIDYLVFEPITVSPLNIF